MTREQFAQQMFGQAYNDLTVRQQLEVDDAYEAQQGPGGIKPDGWVEYDSAGNEFIWQDGKRTATGQKRPERAGTAKPQGAITRKELEDLKAEFRGSVATIQNADGTFDEYHRNPDGTYDIFRSNVKPTPAKPETQFERMSRQLKELQGGLVGAATGAAAGPSAPASPTTGMTNVGGVNRPGQLVTTPGGATVDLLYPSSITTNTMGFDIPGTLRAHGMVPSGDPRKDAETALALRAEAEAYRERFPDESPEDIRRRVAGPRYDPLKAALAEQARGIRERTATSRSSAGGVEWYDPSDFGFAEGGTIFDTPGGVDKPVPADPWARLLDPEEWPADYVTPPEPTMSPYIGPSRPVPPPPVPILGGFDAWGLRQGADPWAGMPRFTDLAAPTSAATPAAAPAAAQGLQGLAAGNVLGLSPLNFMQLLRQFLPWLFDPVTGQPLRSSQPLAGGGASLAGGGQMTLNEPSTVVGNQTGTPYASLAEPDPMTGQPRPEALTVTPLAGGNVPGGPTPFAMLVERLFTDLRTGKRRRTGSLRAVGATG